MLLLLLLLLLLALFACEGLQPLLGVNALPERAELPDPFVAFHGSAVVHAADSRAHRRPELPRLFSHDVHGFSPPATTVTSTPLAHEDDLAGGFLMTRSSCATAHQARLRPRRSCSARVTRVRFRSSSS